MEKEKKQYWSMTEGVFNCLVDKKRTGAFKKAILNTVREGDVVVDMGTGSGVLAMLAVRAGAKKVYAVELDKNNVDTLEATFRANGMNEKIVIIQGDVTKIDLPEKVDVIIGEMVSTGLIEELQVLATNNILRFAKNNCRVLLNRYKTFVDVVYNKDSYYGLKFEMIRYEYPDLEELKSKSFSPKYIISDIDFTKNNMDLVVDKEINLVVNKSGLINAVRLSGETIFYDNSTLGGTFAYSYPAILPMNITKVKEGDIFILIISYQICGGMQKLKYSISKKTHD